MAQKEKKNRKFGRHARNPSSKAYVIGKRWIINKEKAVKRHARRMAKKAIRKILWLADRRMNGLTLGDKSRIHELRKLVAQNL